MHRQESPFPAHELGCEVRPGCDSHDANMRDISAEIMIESDTIGGAESSRLGCRDRAPPASE